MSDGALLIGIDVGTTAVKGAAFTEDGVCRAHLAVPYPMARPRAGWAEQNPDDWLAAIRKILAEIARTCGPDRIVGIGVCSQVNTHVFVDEAGKALAPAIVWQDVRAAGCGEALDAQLDPAEKIRWWGAALTIDASNPVARMAWMAEHEPDLWRQTRWVLSPKDYCLLHLTGVAVADAPGSVGLVDTTGAYATGLLDLVPGAGDKVAPIEDPAAVIGRLKPGWLGEASVPVAAGTMDAWANFFGTGAARPGTAAYVSGTSEIIGIVTGRPAATQGVFSFMPWRGLHIHAAPTQSGGGALEWFSGVMDQPVDRLLSEAASALEAGSAPVLFLPHLQGERGPLWDPYSRASFSNINTGTDRGALALAVLEGVALSARLLFDTAVRVAEAPPEYLYLSGGGSRSDLWCQLRADHFGLPMRRVETADSGTLGAAMIAAVAIGRCADPGEAAARMVRLRDTFEPRADMRARCEDLYARYQETYAALAPLSRARLAPRDP